MDRWYRLASCSFHVARTSLSRAPAAARVPSGAAPDDDDEADAAPADAAEKMPIAAVALLRACSRLFCVAAILERATVRAKLTVLHPRASAMSRSAAGSWQRSASRRSAAGPSAMVAQAQ
jgi:hypothetical protein